MQRIEIDLDVIEQAQLHAFAVLNNVTIEQAASMLIASKLSEAVNKVLDEMLLETSPATSKRTQ